MESLLENNFDFPEEQNEGREKQKKNEIPSYLVTDLPKIGGYSIRQKFKNVSFSEAPNIGYFDTFIQQNFKLYQRNSKRRERRNASKQDRKDMHYMEGMIERDNLADLMTYNELREKMIVERKQKKEYDQKKNKLADDLHYYKIFSDNGSRLTLQCADKFSKILEENKQEGKKSSFIRNKQDISNRPSISTSRTGEQPHQSSETIQLQGIMDKNQFAQININAGVLERRRPSTSLFQYKSTTQQKQLNSRNRNLSGDQKESLLQQLKNPSGHSSPFSSVERSKQVSHSKHSLTQPYFLHLLSYIVIPSMLMFSKDMSAKKQQTKEMIQINQILGYRKKTSPLSRNKSYQHQSETKQSNQIILGKEFLNNSLILNRRQRLQVQKLEHNSSHSFQTHDNKDINEQDLSIKEKDGIENKTVEQQTLKSSATISVNRPRGTSQEINFRIRKKQKSNNGEGEPIQIDENFLKKLEINHTSIMFALSTLKRKFGIIKDKRSIKQILL